MADPRDITNWLRLDERTVTSGQPSETQLMRIASLGVGYVVNLGLHTHKRALADEAGTVAALGMCYIHIPVAFDAPREEDFNRFLAALEVAQGVPLYVHCILNARVSAFFLPLQAGGAGLGLRRRLCRHGANLAPRRNLGRLYRRPGKH